MSNYPVRVSSQQNIRAALTGNFTPTKFIQLHDVNMNDVQDGDLVIYDEATETFIPISRNNLVFEVVTTDNINATGIATIGNITITASGIITSSNPGISTVIYYGDGSQLFGVKASDILIQNQDLVNAPVYPIFASNVGVSSLGISSEEFVFIPTSGYIGIGTNTPTSKLHVEGNGYFVGVITANTFYGNLIGTATTATNVVGGIGSLSSLKVSGISTIPYINSANINVSGVVTAPSFVGNLTGTATTATNLSDAANITTGTINPSRLSGSYNIKVSYANTAGISTVAQGLTGTPNINVGIVTASSFIGNLTGTATTATNVSGGIGSLTSLRVSGVSTVNSLVASNISVSGIVTAPTFVGNLTGTATTATKLENIRTFEVTGDIVAAPQNFDGTQNVSLASSIQPNTVGLGTHTYGDYVKNITGTTGEIEVSITSGEGASPQIGLPNNVTIGNNLTVTNDLQVNHDLNVNGNITIGGTSAYLIVDNFIVKDRDIVSGFVTDAYGNETSNDTTANTGGIAVASTEGTPIINLNIPGIEILPPTYKKLMWFKAGSFSGLGTDAWMFNYGVGIGSTQIPNGVRLAIGGVQFTENDLSKVRNINASGIVTASSINSGNINSSGIITASSFVGNVTGTATTATNVVGGIGSLSSLTVSGISTLNNVNVATLTASGIVTASSFVPSSGYIKAPDGTNSFYIYSGTGNVAFQGTIGASQVNNQSGYKVLGFSGLNDATFENNVYIAGVTTSIGGFVGNLTGTATTATNVVGGIGSVSSLTVSGLSTFSRVSSGNIISSGIITASQFSTGSNGIGINTNTIFGPSVIIIDPAGVGDNTGIVRIAGDFYVDGTQTVINSTTLEVADLQIGIGTTAINDIALDGAGIGIGSTSNRKTFVWEYSTSSLKSSENINLASGKTYRINGTDVLSSNTLGSGVVNSSLTSVGTLGNLNVSGVSTLPFINGTNINISGIATASSFVGNLAGTATTAINSGYATTAGIATVAQGLTGTPNIVVGVVTASTFIGNLTGTATTATNLSDAANITTGIINPSRLSGTYNINVDYANTSGVSTSVVGGIASVTSLNVSGVATVSSNLTVNGNTFFVDAANNRVGILTTSPVQPLQVGTGSSIFVIDTQGEIGIGTTNPTRRLHIFGDSTTNQFNTALSIMNTNATGYGAYVGLNATSITSGRDWRLVSNGTLDTAGVGNFSIYDQVAGVDRFVIDSSGNVGIGSTSIIGPIGTRILSATNGIRAGSTSIYCELGPDFGTNLELGTGSTTLPTYIDFHGADTTYPDFGARIIRNAGDNSNFDINNRGTGNLRLVVSEAGNIDFITNNAFRQRIDANGTILIGTASSTGTASQRLQVNSGAYFNGNLGLGNTNPTSRLQVTGDGNFSGVVTATTFNGQINAGVGTVTTLSSTNATLTNINSSGITTVGFITATNLNVSGVGTFLSSGLQIRNPANTFGYTLTGAAIAADRILNLPLTTGTDTLACLGLSQTFTGNITVGGNFNHTGVTQSFNAINYTTGTVTIGGPSQTGTITLGQATVSQTLNLASGVSGVGTTKTINLGTGGGSGSNTLITIGSATAGAASTVTIPSPTNLLIGTATTTGTASQPLQVTGGAYISGSVGIGTINPSDRLHVLGGNIRVDGSTGQLSFWNVAGYYGGIGVAGGMGGSGTDIVIRSDATRSIIFFTGGANDRGRIDASGTFLVGSATSTGTATQRLQVTGGAYVSGNTGIGTTNPVSTLQVKDALAFETINTTTTTTNQVAVDTFATATFRSAKYHTQITCPGQIATLGGITTGGRGYTAGTFNITFTTSSGTGSAAQGTLTISNGTVGQIGITSGGTGYLAGDVLTAGGGSGLQVSVGSTDGTGAILTLGAITSAGIGYTGYFNPTTGTGTTSLTLLGGTGSNAVGLATIFDGVITSSSLLQQPITGTGGTVYYSGSNYTTGSVLTINKSDVTNTITTITTDLVAGISTFTSLTAHGIGVSDVIRVPTASNGLAINTDYFVVTVPSTTTFTLGTAVGVGTTFTAGTSLSIGFFRNSASNGGNVAYTNAITGVSTNYQVSDLLVLQNGSTTDYVEYGTIANNDILGTFATDISGANARLLFTPTYPNNTVKVVRQAITL